MYVIQVCFRTVFVMLAQTWNFLLRLSMNKSEQPDMHICTLQQHAAWFRAFHFRFTEVPQPYAQLVSSSVSWRQDLWSCLLLFSSHGELSRLPVAAVVQLKPKYLCLSTLKKTTDQQMDHTHHQSFIQCEKSFHGLWCVCVFFSTLLF